MKGSIKTQRWNDPVTAGFQLLITRYRPRGVSKAKETWDEWWPDLGPSKELLADFKAEPPIAWSEYQARYLEEMEREDLKIAELARRVKRGETITLLCSSACTDPARCHRTLLKTLVEKA